MGKNNHKTQDNLIVEDQDVKNVEDLKKELETTKEQYVQTENQLKRAVADYQNLEKRVIEEKQEFASWANAEIIKKIVPILDNLEKALIGAKEEEKNSGWYKGVALSTKQLQELLKSEGLDELQADGQFDPSLHEAVDTENGEDSKILKVLEKGYTLNGKVLKPVKVIVGRKGIN